LSKAPIDVETSCKLFTRTLSFAVEVDLPVKPACGIDTPVKCRLMIDVETTSTGPLTFTAEQVIVFFSESADKCMLHY